MKKEDRDLLLKDLCGRLPYGAKGLLCEDSVCELEQIWTRPGYESVRCSGDYYDISDFKPYLFSLSGLSNEQFKIVWDLEHSGDMEHLSIPLLDWLNEHHFDYRGLIEKGLAIDATGLDIYKEEQK